MALKILSLLAIGIPLPWVFVAAARWLVKSHVVVVSGEEYRPSFSGRGISLFWYFVGLALSPLLLLLIAPPVLRGLLAWAARFTNIIGIEKSVEFEFSGENKRLYGYVYLNALMALVIFIAGNVVVFTFDAGMTVRLIAFSSMFVIALIVQSFIICSFVRWFFEKTRITTA